MEKVNVVLDMKGLSCPRPLIGAKRMVDELSAGQVLLVEPASTSRKAGAASSLKPT